jgi:hypothetical protein
MIRVNYDLLPVTLVRLLCVLPPFLTVWAEGSTWNYSVFAAFSMAEFVDEAVLAVCTWYSFIVFALGASDLYQSTRTLRAVFS